MLSKEAGGAIFDVNVIDCDEINARFENAGAIEILQWVYDTFARDTIKLSTSFGAEGTVLLRMLVDLVKMPRVFTIDTGRLFPQTYKLWQEIIDTYGIEIETWFPDPRHLQELTRRNGPDLMYATVENRKQCCFVRKVEPLRDALADATVWITAIRRSQSQSRKSTSIISYVEQYDVFKVCPLYNWSEENVWEYIRNNGIPHNSLYDEGYRTIGCTPCCRSVGPALHIRDGRWWWETDAPKECGIHVIDGKMERKTDADSYSI